MFLILSHVKTITDGGDENNHVKDLKMYCM